MIGKIFNIEKYRIHDGEGIRTAVFLKGCNLHCPWCCNPESQSMATQTVVHRSLCTACLSCYRNCPKKAVYYVGNIVKTKSDLCDACGICVRVCPNSARQIYGKEASTEEVMKEVLKDAVYYSRSGGGVTVSGGEPLLQHEFTRELLQLCKQEYFHTAVETAGFVPWAQAWAALAFADTVLMDVKASDVQAAAAFLPDGSDPAQMLEMQHENIRRLVQQGKEVILRCPIIPDFNDNARHIEAVAHLAADCGIDHVDLLPFHQFGKNKYDALGLPYSMQETPAMSNEQLLPYLALLQQHGLKATIGG